jgi:hypothetical protein
MLPCRCFISSEYGVARLRIHHIPVSANCSTTLPGSDSGFPYQLLIAAVVIVTCYGLVFLVLLGIISFTRHRSLGPTVPLSDEISRQRVVIAKRMLW